jgi:hypothetical protein
LLDKNIINDDGNNDDEKLLMALIQIFELPIENS